MLSVWATQAPQIDCLQQATIVITMTTRVRWYGQSAFRLAADHSVFIDPFGVPGERVRSRGIEFRFPPIEGVDADLLLVTHEHFDHNAVEAIDGEPVVLRSTAGRLDSPFGEVVAVASEHDDQAGTARGPNTIFCFDLGGHRFCHMGDFGQPELRPAQRDAIGAIDVLFVPVGGGPTVGADAAATVVRELQPALVVPMHFRTPHVNFLEPPDAFLHALGAPVERVGGPELAVESAIGTRAAPNVALLALPS
jgi:L-ascorbate metabolism protein UlaG (beta-lactamase superfamily)